MTWTLKQVDAMRASVLAHLDRALPEGLDARLSAALEQVVATEHDYSGDGQLSRVLNVIAALAHHGRWGGLPDRDATELHSLAESILRAHGVEKASSTLSVLWGELLLAKSQALRLAGRAYESVWEQHLSHQASRRSPVGTPAFHSLAAGLRAARLGLLDVACAALRHAEEGALPERNHEQARLVRIQATRLSGNYDEAKALLRDLEHSKLSPVAARDAAWERCIQAASDTSELEAMLTATSARGGHRDATFLLETFLWTRAVKSRQYEERTPGIKAMRKSASELLTRAAAFRACFDACRHLDDAYDPEKPLAMRLRAVGGALGDAALMPSLDKELLLRAAAFRWLLRAKQTEFAAFVLADYEMRCLAISAGKTRDALRVLTDVDRAGLLGDYVAPTLRSAS